MKSGQKLPASSQLLDMGSVTRVECELVRAVSGTTTGSMSTEFSQGFSLSGRLGVGASDGADLGTIHTHTHHID